MSQWGAERWYYREFWSWKPGQPSWKLKQKIGPELLGENSDPAMFPFGSPDPTWSNPNPPPYYYIVSIVWDPGIRQWKEHFTRSNFEPQMHISGNSFYDVLNAPPKPPPFLLVRSYGR
jgi:hypothetical protein